MKNTKKILVIIAIVVVATTILIGGIWIFKTEVFEEDSVEATTSRDAISEDTDSKEISSENMTSAETSANTTSKETTLGETIPEETIPEETIPEETVSEDKSSVETNATDSENEQILKDEAQNILQSVMDSTIAEDDESNEILMQTENKNGFEVLSCHETESGLSATVRVYAPNLYMIAKEIDENYTFESDEELEKAILEAIEEAEIIEQEMTIQYQMTENGYEPLFSMDFLDAYYGGIFKLLGEAINQKTEG